MYTSKDIAEAIEKIPADDLDATAIARSRRLSRKRSINHADGMIVAAPLCGEVAAASRWLTAAQLPDPEHVRNANPRGSSIARPA
jgi:hypothetical protein